MRLLVIFLSGVLFGFGLAISGMTNPAIVAGFLDVTGDWDARLAFVMAGALGSFALFMAVWRKKQGGAGWFGTRLPKGESEPVSRSLVAGAILFGAGWGLSGFCPGPAIANLGALRWEAIVFVPCMLVGMLMARWLFRSP